MVLIVEEAEPMSSGEELELVRETEAAEETARETETTTKPSDIAALGLTQEETEQVCIKDCALMIKAIFSQQ